MKLSIEFIEKTICEEENLDKGLLHVRTRKREVAEIRQVIMTFAVRFGHTLQEAGDYFGLDHATANHARKTINNIYDTEKCFREKMDRYENILIGNQKYTTHAERYLTLKKQTEELLSELQKIAV